MRNEVNDRVRESGGGTGAAASDAGRSTSVSRGPADGSGVWMAPGRTAGDVLTTQPSGWQAPGGIGPADPGVEREGVRGAQGCRSGGRAVRDGLACGFERSVR